MINKFHCDYLLEYLCDKIKLCKTRCNWNKNRFDQLLYQINFMFNLNDFVDETKLDNKLFIRWILSRIKILSDRNANFSFYPSH